MKFSNVCGRVMSSAIGTRIYESNNMSSVKDWNSVLLLLLLTIPTSVMAIMLFFWSEISWVAAVPFTAIGILGAFTQMLLSVFIIARYRNKNGIVFVSAGLLSMALINGVQSIVSPESSDFIWLHSLAGISGSLFFSLYVLVRLDRFQKNLLYVINTRYKSFLFLTVVLSAAITGCALGFSHWLPPLIQGSQFTSLAWIMNGIPLALYMFSGVSLFALYRKSCAQELFLFTAILIFLFQASEVTYLAPLWSVIWWFWLTLQLAVYVTVLGFVLREYMLISSSLSEEIEERTLIEFALRKAEENWRNSFNSLQEIMMIIDDDCRIENINISGLVLLDKQKDEVVGKKISEVFPEVTKEVCPVIRSRQSGKAEHLEYYSTALQKHFSAKSSPIYDEDSNVSKYVYLMEDITDRVGAKAKEKLLQKELNLTSRLASIGEVAAGITHEINNPLTSVMAFAQILSVKKLPEDIKEAVEVINDGASRIANIVEKLLTFARRHKPEKEYVSINSVISNIIGMRSYEMKNNNIELITNLSSSLPETMANIGEMQQVLMNIIINAEQAIKGAEIRAGKIYIQSALERDMIVIVISDNGPGISEEAADKLFNPFFTTKEKSGGTGLGLSISYGIIKEHGGNIYTKDQGEGATFVIELPVIADETKSQPSVQETKKKIKVPHLKILVVDDEMYICRALDTLLTQEGHEVVTIRVSEQALEKVKNSEFDLVLFDIKMPGIDGIEFYRKMKRINPALGRKAICITGDIISPRNKEFIEKTGIPFIPKPFGTDELIQTINEVTGDNKGHAKITHSYR